MKLLFATKNDHKLKEVRNILDIPGLEITSLNDIEDNTNIIEDGKTFEANAIKKAKEIYSKYGMPVIADDSGIMAEQINFAPGIYSARYAGENASDKDNNEKLISVLKYYGEPHHAKYFCAAVYYDGKDLISTSGQIEGKIIYEPRGNNGFGYDPHFIPEGYEMTMAELSPIEKDTISHRGKAFRDLRNELEKRLQSNGKQ